MLDNLSLKQKAIVLLVFFALSMLFTLLFSTSTVNKLSELNQIRANLGHVHVGVLELRKSEKDFLMRKKLKYHDSFKKKASQTSDQISTVIEELSEHDWKTQSLEQAKHLFSGYTDNFGQLVAMQVKIGLGPKLGLYGALRTSVRNAESLLKKSNQVRLTKDMLILRRREKDFMLRWDANYIGKFKKDYATFLKDVQTSNLRSSRKKELKNFMASYKKDFLAFTEGIKQLGLNEKLGIRGSLRSKIQNFTKAINKEITVIEGLIEEEVAAKKWIMVIVSILLGLITLGLTIFIVRSILKPLGGEPGEMAIIAETIAGGDFTIDSSGIDKATGLYFSMLKMKKDLSNTISEVKRNATNLSSSSTELAAVSGQMSSSAVEMNTQTEGIAAASTQMKISIESVAAGATQMSQNMQSVLSGVEEMSNSVEQVTQQSDVALGIALQAREESEEITTIMTDLGVFANEIGNVTDMIKKIAQQTNLLALNATIEAARAGEAGKGFAVVANEIKELAKQSASAAEDISHKIEGIQSQSNRSIESIKGITQVISDVSSSSENINQLTREQSASSTEVLINIRENAQAIEEVAKMVNEMSNSATEVSLSITELNEASKQTSVGSSEVNTQAGELSKIAELLGEMMQKFKIDES